MEKFFDRLHAGRLLAEELQSYSNNESTQVLALPRGGVPVAYPIAELLSLALDILIVRKLGLPQHPELAFGAIASGEALFINEQVTYIYNIPQTEIDRILQNERKELLRREDLYRQNRPFPQLKDKKIILVDDGIATGATMYAAIQASRQFKPEEIIIAVPVIAAETYKEMRPLVDKIVYLLKPEHLYAVGCWYENFSQTTDDEVIHLLNK